MTHAEAPELSIEQRAFEATLRDLLSPGTSVSFARNRAGFYHAEFVRQAWALWQAARDYERRPSI